MLDTSKYVNTLNSAAAPLGDDVLRRLFLDARTHNGWRDAPVDDATLRRLYELAKLGPTSANTQPLRLVFVKSIEAKRRLVPALFDKNIEKTMSAPVTAIVAHDLAFPDHLPRLLPHVDARSWFAHLPPERLEKVAVQGATLQAAYLMLAARALGLDVGPIGGFDAAKVDEAFFAGTTWRSDFLINLGHGDSDKLFPRSPRLDFDDACRIE